MPSELLALKWEDIDWDLGRITIESKKTKRQGKPYRIIPLFAELRSILEDAREVAPEGAVFVISRYRQKNANLRTQFERILRRAKVQPWTRLFHSMRASRQTELQNRFPGHVVADWMGNSEAIAFKHYLMTTDDHFEQAVASPRVVQQVVQQPAEGRRNAGKSEHHSVHHSESETAQNPSFLGVFGDSSVPPRGVEPLSSD